MHLKKKTVILSQIRKNEAIHVHSGAKGHTGFVRRGLFLKRV